MSKQRCDTMWRARWARELVRWVGLFAGGVLTALGILLAVTPLPFGAVLMAMGLVTLISVSPTVARIMRNIRARTRPLDVALCAVERICPRRIANILRSTSPFQPRALVVRAQA